MPSTVAGAACPRTSPRGDVWTARTGRSPRVRAQHFRETVSIPGARLLVPLLKQQPWGKRPMFPAIERVRRQCRVKTKGAESQRACKSGSALQQLHNHPLLSILPRPRAARRRAIPQEQGPSQRGASGHLCSVPTYRVVPERSSGWLHSECHSQREAC